MNMKYRFLDPVKDLISVILNYLVTASVWVMLLGIIKIPVNIYKLLLGLLIGVCLYIIRTYINRLIFYLTAHLITGVLFITLLKGTVYETAVNTIVILFMVTVSFLKRVKTSDSSEKPIHPGGASGIMLVCFIVLNYLKETEVLKLMPKFTLLFAALYLVYIYLRQYLWFDFMNRKVITKMPTRDLVKADAPYVGLLTVFYIITCLLCLDEALIQRLSDWIHEKIKAFMIWLLSLIPKGEVTAPMQENNIMLQNPMEGLGIIEEVKEPSILAKILEKVVIYVAIIIAVAGVISILVFIVYTIIKRFKGVDNEKLPDAELDYTEEKEKLDRRNKEKGRAKRGLITTPSEKIRRLYFEIVRHKNKTCEKPEKVTAREFMMLLNAEDEESAFSFAKIYEKARYSPLEISKEDVKTAKRLYDILIKENK